MGTFHQPPSSVFQVAWELLRGSEESGWASGHHVSGAGPHTPAPQPLWASRTPIHPRRAAVNCDARGQQRGGVSWGPSCLRPHILASHLPGHHQGLLGQHVSLPRGRRAFPPIPSWLPVPASSPGLRGSCVSLEMATSPLLTPTQHRTKHKR